MDLIAVERFDQVLRLSKQESNRVGFIPEPRLRREFCRECIITYEEDGKVLGYLHHSPIGKETRIHQIVVDQSVRRCGIGSVLVRMLICKTPLGGKVTLRCRDGLEANHFWPTLGFEIKGARPGGRARGRMINCYER